MDLNLQTLAARSLSSPQLFRSLTIAEADLTADIDLVEAQLSREQREQLARMLQEAMSHPHRMTAQQRANMSYDLPAQGWQNLDVKDKWKEAVASERVIASYSRNDVNCLCFHPDENMCSGGAVIYISCNFCEEAVDDVNDKPLSSADGLCHAWVYSCS